MKNTRKVAGILSATAALAATPAMAGDDSQRFYAGLFAGASFLDPSVTDAILLTYGEEQELLEGGALIGFRHDVLGPGHFLGVEADIGIAGDFEGDGTAYWSDYFGSGHVRGLIGKEFDGLSVFGALGLAIARAEYLQLASIDYQDLTLLGVSLGVGAEFEVHDGFSIRLEALHDIYGSVEFDDGYNGDWRSTTVRAAAIFDLN